MNWVLAAGRKGRGEGEMGDNEKARKIRCFIAVEISDEARAELSRIIGILKGSRSDVKWVVPDSVHLTMKFLGYISEEKVPAITGKLDGIAREMGPFDMMLSGIGVFPDWGYARVLWVGVGDGSEKAKDLAACVEEAMAQQGFEKEKRSFSPHLTLGRIRTSKNKNELKKLTDTIEVRPAAIRISRIVLFRSDLTPKGAVYTPLHTADLSA
ncbi:MAG: RNA 2',3'-cyclic phosphodiesterase [Candidatus Omnitrophota bacterium]|nr:RNA 2',3'-cyclic phosphodiesterase [Candidatus Omnitrophota bacterium]